MERPGLPPIRSLEDMPRYLEAQSLLLDDLNVRTQKLLEVTEKMQQQMEKVPEGLTYPIELTITGNTITAYELTKEPDAGSRPWFSCTVYNDGSDDVLVRANSPVGRFQRVEQGESVDIDFKAPKLKSLFFKCDTATSNAALRILGEA